MSKLRSQLNILTAGMTSSGGTRPDKYRGNIPDAHSANSGLSPESPIGSNDRQTGSITSRDMSEPQENRNDENRRELAKIKSALQNLTQDLTAAGNNTNNEGGPKTSNAPSIQFNAKEIDTGVLAQSLAQSLRENLRDQMATEIDKMRRELGALQQSANEANDRVVLDDIQRISEGIHELQSRHVVSPDQFGEMAGELRGIQRDIRSLTERPEPQFNAQEISNSIQVSYDEIAKRLDSLGSSQTSNHIEALSEKLEAIKDSIPTTDPQTLLRIENLLQALSTGITDLADNGMADANGSLDAKLPGYFESLDRRMDEITRAIMASASIDNFASDGSAFDRIEARIASLAKSVDSLSHDDTNAQQNPQLANLMQMPEQLQTTLARLEDQIAQLSMSPMADETQINEKFGSQLASLASKIDQLQLASPTTSGSGAIDTGIGAKLDSISLILERAINSGDSSVGQLESQIAELSNRIEQAVSADQAEQQNRLLNESRIVEELQTLATRVELIDTAQANKEPYDLQLSALENQITSIASQLQSIGGQADLSAIETRLGGIEEQFAASRDVAIEAANHAAQQAVSMSKGENYTSAISALAEDLKNLTQSSTELKGHSLETFDAVRDSLSMILDRINSIEVRIANEELSPGFASSPPAPHNETHNADMVDAARQYAYNLAARDADAQYQKAGCVAPDNVSRSGEHSDNTTLPQVEAPSLDLQHLPETEGPPAQTEELAGNDLPLEPGSGAPDLAGNGLNMDALMRQAKENKRKETLEDEQQNPTDFIAAARRAAQAAANEENLLNEEAKKNSKTGHRFSFREFFSRRKKPVMLVAAAVVLAAIAFPVIKYFPAPASLESAQSEQTDVEAVEQPAEADKVTQNPQVTQSETASQQVSSPVSSPEPTTGEQVQIDVLPLSAQIPDTNAVVPEPDDAALPSVETPQAGQETRQITLAPMPAEEVGPIALRQAAASGNPKALYEVGSRYTTGINGKPDLKEAAIWYQRAANSNYAPAQYRLGNFYEKGHGLASDVNQAAIWYKRAAEQGNALAMHNLAVINAMGVLDGGANMIEASTWFKKAAEHGVKDSQVNLGIVYAKAMGVEVSLAKAYKWFAIAAKAGDKDAAQKRDTVAAQMRPDQLEAARGEVELWRPQQLNADANSVDIPAEWKTVPQTTASLTGTQMIKKTQTILTKLGFKLGPADGIMGAKTTRAIKKFQTRAGIAVDGKVTTELVSALEKAKI